MVNALGQNTFGYNINLFYNETDLNFYTKIHMSEDENPKFRNSSIEYALKYNTYQE